MHTLNILLITKYLPYPPIVGHPIRNYNLFNRISAQGHRLWIATFENPSILPEHIEQAQRFAKDVYIASGDTHPGALDRPIEMMQYLLSGTPPDLRLMQWPDMIKKIGEWCRGIKFDIVQIEDSYMALYLNALPKELRSRSILTFHDIDHEKYDRIWRIEKKTSRKLRLWLHSILMKKWEPRFVQGFGRCVTVSERDRDVLLRLNPLLNIRVVRNGIDTHLFQPLPEKEGPPRLIFVGDMGYIPNIDAMLFFANEILPIIRQQMPTVETWIVGANPSPEMTALHGKDGVVVTGRVEDVRPFYQQSDICVVPLRAGGGTRLKIPESMALCRPVISTSIGCEGLDVEHGKHLMIADQPADFARQTIQLLNDKVLRDQITKNGLELVRDVYEWNAVTKDLLRVYEELID